MSIWPLTKNTRVCVHPSVYDALKYFTETVTPRTFSKIVLPHNFLSCSSFCVNIFSKSFLLFVPAFVHVTVKNFIGYWSFECFLNRLSPILFFVKIVLVYWHFIKTSKSVFLSLIMPQWNISSKVWNFECS